MSGDDSMTVDHRPLAPPVAAEVPSPGRTVSGAAELDALALGAVIYAELRRPEVGDHVPVAAVRVADGWLPTGAPWPVTSESIADLARAWSVLRRPDRRATPGSAS